MPGQEQFPPTMRALTSDQEDALHSGRLSIRTNAQGKYVVKRESDNHVGIGRTPRLAIEDLK